MLDISRASHNALTKRRITTSHKPRIPAQSSQPLNIDASLPTIIPTLPNATGLRVVTLGSTLPRESMPRIMNPADIPLTDAARFKTSL